MKVDDNFFQDEERCGFWIESKMKRFWASEIEVLEEIRRVCKKHNIKWFADWGTLLGAVRHKGFIPWDDDLDICMLRDDWNRFAEVAPKELSKWFEVSNLYNDVTQDNCIMRVINNRHICFEEEFLEKFHMCPFSAGIDIFPVDYIPRDADKDKQLVHLVKTLMVTSATVSKEPPYTNDDREIVKMWEDTLGVQINWKNRLFHEMKKLVDIAMQQCDQEDAEDVCYMLERQMRLEYHIPKEYFNDWIEIPFEYTTVPIPKNYDYILKLEYGNDYMVPQKIKSGHDYPVYKEQEIALKDVLEAEFNVKMELKDVQNLIDMKVFGTE